jgi:hypothetical protein
VNDGHTGFEHVAVLITHLRVASLLKQLPRMVRADSACRTSEEILQPVHASSPAARGKIVGFPLGTRLSGRPVLWYQPNGFNRPQSPIIVAQARTLPCTARR